MLHLKLLLNSLTIEEFSLDGSMDIFLGRKRRRFYLKEPKMGAFLFGSLKVSQVTMCSL